MSKPYLEPVGNDDYKIVHPQAYYGSSSLLKKFSSGEISGDEAIARLKEALSKYPYNFDAAYALSETYAEYGDFENACDTRFQAVQRFMEILPDDEDIAFDWDTRENQSILYLLSGSGIDHFLIGDYEMAAGLLETALMLDGDDHLDVSPTLAFCYIALGEEDSFDMTMQDIPDKSPEKIVLKTWGEYTFGKQISPESRKEFRNGHKALYGEFTADEHPATDEYMADIDSQRPSPEARARQLWLRTEHLWNEFPGFIEQLKN